MGFTFDLPLETAGKRDRRIDIAQRLSESATFEIGERAWAIHSRLRSNLVAHFLAVREVELLRAEAAIREKAASVIEKKRSAGEVSRPEVDAAQIELTTTRLAIRVAEGRVAESRAALAQMIGVPASALAGATFAWPDFDEPPVEDALRLEHVQDVGLTNRLDVQRALADYAAAEAALALEVANQYPDVHLGPSYFWDQGQHKFALGVSMTIPLLNQGPPPNSWVNREQRTTTRRTNGRGTSSLRRNGRNGRK